MKHKKFIIGNTIGLGVVAAVLIALNVAVLGTSLRQLITTYLGGSGLEQSEESVDSFENALSVSEQIMDEGIVLLKNENDALPLGAEDTSEEINVNVFGINTINMYYGGSGSGASSTDDANTYLDAYEEANINYNQDIIDLMNEHYSEADTDVGSPLGGTFYPARPTIDTDYYIEHEAEYKEFSDIAIVNIGRTGGEGLDLPAGETGDFADQSGNGEVVDYLTFSDEEIELIEWAGETFGTTIVCLNVANPMQCSILDSDDIDAVLWIGHPGAYAITELGKVLRGEVNPSGRLVDTWAYDTKSSPAYYNANRAYTGVYSNMTDMGSYYSYYVDYVEGIYVGYRYYETKYANDESGYQEAVQYPFGYGLSYTDFSWNVTDYDLSDETITIDVEVTNTGDTAGKDVVELYSTPPYTTGEIEKAEKNLVAFEKTEIIEPGESDTVTLEFDKRDLSSYDYNDANNDNHTGYELEEGDYVLTLSTDAHNGKEDVDPITLSVDSTVYYDTSEYTGYEIENRFEDAQSDDEDNENVQYLSRADNFTENWPTTLENRTYREAPEKVQNAVAHENDIVDDDSDTYPTTGTITHYVDAEERDEDGNIVYDENGDVVYATTVDDDGNVSTAQRGLYLEDMTGLDYDDPLWDDLLNQLSVDEMATLISEGGYQTAAVESINKGLNRDLDGPQGINFSNVSVEQLTDVMSYPSEIVVASTWNKELAELQGEAFGYEAQALGVTGVYAPAVNIHRQPYGGRNFEYYSEDPLVSGKMAAGFVIGAQSQGLNTYVKHFAVNDQEYNRTGLFTYLNEQSLREIYLKPFQLAVEEGGTRCIMSSFNRIGTTWTGASYELLTEVLRNEWGFEGCVITDYYMYFYTYMDPNQGLRAGNDLWLTGFTMFAQAPDLTSATSQQQARRACHNILYVVANANATDVTLNESWLYWFIPVDVVLWLAWAGWLAWVVYKGIKYQKDDDDNVTTSTEEEATASV